MKLLHLRMALLSLTLMVAGMAQKNTPRGDGDWPMFLHDLYGTRYSPLNQINTTNVSRLTRAWFYAFNRPGKPIHG